YHAIDTLNAMGEIRDAIKDFSSPRFDDVMWDPIKILDPCQDPHIRSATRWAFVAELPLIADMPGGHHNGAIERWCRLLASWSRIITNANRGRSTSLAFLSLQPIEVWMRSRLGFHALKVRCDRDHVACAPDPISPVLLHALHGHRSGIAGPPHLPRV